MFKMEILQEVLSDSEGADIYWKMEGKKFTSCLSLKCFFSFFFKRGKSFGTPETLQKRRITLTVVTC